MPMKTLCGSSIANGLQTELYSRPSFLLRQCHQIATSLFLESTAPYDITPAQLSVMVILKWQPKTDQKTLCVRAGLDRATISEIARRLERRGLIRRLPGRTDRRSKSLSLTPEGQKLLATLQPMARRASTSLVSPLSAAEQRQFLAMMQRLVDGHPGVARAMFEPPP